jgi:hypothetical protein
MLKEKYKNIRVQVTKIKDNKFDGNHPNFIIEGYKTEGFVQIGEVGDVLYIAGLDKWLRTTIIESIKENDGYDLIHTRNSIYKIEKVINPDYFIYEEKNDIGDLN